MASRDHEPYIFDSFMGLYNRTRAGGTEAKVPPEYARECKNMIFYPEGVRTRQEMAQAATWIPNMKRIFHYKFLGVNLRALILTYDGVNGRIYVDTALGAPIIGPIAGMIDFSAVMMFNRVYITPHNRIRGLSGQVVYVWDGTTLRQAAGLMATGVHTLTDTAAGRIETGWRVVAYGFETSSGFITKPNAPIPLQRTAASRNLQINNIAVGPAGTVARVTLASKIIRDYDASRDPRSYELFKIPNGRIANNVATTITVDFFDNELVDSADYLNDQLDSIPAGVAICSYKGRLVVAGQNGQESVVRVSKPGDPESFSSIDGFILCDPGFGEGVKNVKECFGNLVMTKSFKSYSTSDNGGSITTWPVNLIDAGLGAEPFAIGIVASGPGHTSEVMFFANPSGLYAYNGVFSAIPLSYVIEGHWQSSFNTFPLPDSSLTQVVVDPQKKRIFVILAKTRWYMCDYTLGISPDKVRWSTWDYGSGSLGIPQAIDMSPAVSGNDLPDLKAIFTSSSFGYSLRIDIDINTTETIQSEYATGLFGPDAGASYFHWGEYIVNPVFNGNCDFQRWTDGGVGYANVATGVTLFRGSVIDFISQFGGLRFHISSTNGKIELHRVILYANYAWAADI